jgi:hypothetical protein
MPVETFERLTDIEALIDRIDAYLRGQTIFKDVDGMYKRRQISEPFLSDEGIQEILKLMRMRLDPIIYSASVLDMAFIRTEVLIFNQEIALLLARRAKEWNLNWAYYNSVINYLVTALEAQYRKGLAGTFLRMAAGFPEQRKEEKRRFFFF